MLEKSGGQLDITTCTVGECSVGGKLSKLTDGCAPPTNKKVHTGRGILGGLLISLEPSADTSCGSGIYLLFYESRDPGRKREVKGPAWGTGYNWEGLPHIADWSSI
jgi:hypothetical protein